MGVPILPDTDAARLRPVTKTRSFATARAISAMMLRDMATSYGRSPGGYLWAVLEPAAGVFLLVMIFSIGFRSPPLGTGFAIFYATGLVPFIAYVTISSKLITAIKSSRQLIAYPSVTYLDALVARFLLELITQLLVAYVLFTAILMMSDTQTAPDLLGMALSFSMMAALAFGVGTMNCFLTGWFPVWAQIWGILNRPLFIVSCIFFLFEAVPQPYRDYLWYNPLVHVIGQMRKSIYPYYDAPYVSTSYVFGLSLVLSALGLIFLLRFNRELLTR